MLDATHFRAITNATMMHINDQLEQAFDQGDLDELDFDEGAGILTIITPDDKTFVLSRHEPSRQLWLASPISGGLHFDYSQESQEWQLPDGRKLKQLLAEDLKRTARINIVF